MLSARLSKTGNASPQAGDVQLPDIRVKVGAGDVRLQLAALR